MGEQFKLIEGKIYCKSSHLGSLLKLKNIGPYLKAVNNDFKIKASNGVKDVTFLNVDGVKYFRDKFSNKPDAIKVVEELISFMNKDYNEEMNLTSNDINDLKKIIEKQNKMIGNIVKAQIKLKKQVKVLYQTNKKLEIDIKYLKKLS